MNQPIETTVLANGLRHHVLTWTPPGPPPEATVLLCHGYLDIGWSWRRVAERLVASGRRVVAFDWRGHGRTEWVGAGGYYYFMDYVSDLADLVEVVAPGRLQLVGHSMGGGIAIYFAGTYPQRVERLVVMEGLGPPWKPKPPQPGRNVAWVADVRKARQRRATPPTYAGLEAVLARMRIQNPQLSDEVGMELAERATREVATEHGVGRMWTWDPMQRTRGPMELTKSDLFAFMESISCPVLYVRGEEGYHWPDEADRLSHFGACETLEVPGVGHMLHWMAPDAVAEAVDGFMGPP